MIAVKIAVYASIMYFVSFVCSVQLPDVYWDPNEPMFNETLCDPMSKIIHVREDDSMSIICPNRDLNNAVDTSNQIRLNHYYNIYITDSRDLYRERKSEDDIYGKATLLHRCKEEMSSAQHSSFQRPLVSKKFLQFSPFGITANVKFKAGEEFYVFTTSDGTEKSLNNVKAPKHTKHLGFEIHVCKNKECPYHLTRCLPKPYRRERFTNDDSGNNDSELKWSRPAFIVTILICSVGGLVIGGLIDRLYVNRKNRIEKQKSPEDGSCLSSTGSSTASESAGLMKTKPQPV